MTEAPAQTTPAPPAATNGSGPELAKPEDWASFDDLLGKPKAFDEFSLTFPDGTVRKLRYEAIPGPDFDALMAKCPPTVQQRANGQTYDPMKFASQLLAKVCQRPQATPEQWASLIASPNWSNGEAGQLFERAMDLCMQRMDLGPTSTG